MVESARRRSRGVIRTRVGAGLCVLMLVGSALMAQPVMAAPNGVTSNGVVRHGTLDPTFGAGGIVTTNFPGRQVGASAAGLQWNGAIVVAGGALSEDEPDFLLARYRPNGTLDPAFGDGGRVVTPFPAAQGTSGAEALAVQPDNAIVAVGTGGLGGSNIGFAVARYLPNGRLDPRFGTNGTVVTPVGPAGSAGASGVAVQWDGKIVVVGGAMDAAGNADFAAVRYLRDGRLDPTFGNGGTVLVTIPGGDAAGSAVTLQRDGRIVIAGTAIGPGETGQQFALVRLRRSGALDPTFGGDGIVVAQNFPGQDKGGAQDVAVDFRGRIVAGGLGETAAGQGAFGLVRFRPDGSLDPAFGGGDGMVLTEFTGESGANRVLLRPDGRIVAVGSAGFPSTFALAGYLSNGDLDPKFGTGGRTTTAIGPLSGADGAVLQFGGRIVVAGTTANTDETIGSFAVARYL